MASKRAKRQYKMRYAEGGVISTLRDRNKQIDAAVDAATKTLPTPAAPATPAAPSPTTTSIVPGLADQMAAKQAARQQAEAAAAAAVPPPRKKVLGLFADGGGIGPMGFRVSKGFSPWERDNQGNLPSVWGGNTSGGGLPSEWGRDAQGNLASTSGGNRADLGMGSGSKLGSLVQNDEGGLDLFAPPKPITPKEGPVQGLQALHFADGGSIFAPVARGANAIYRAGKFALGVNPWTAGYEAVTHAPELGTPDEDAFIARQQAESLRAREAQQQAPQPQVRPYADGDEIERNSAFAEAGIDYGFGGARPVEAPQRFNITRTGNINGRITNVGSGRELVPGTFNLGTMRYNRPPVVDPADTSEVPGQINPNARAPDRSPRVRFPHGERVGVRDLVGMSPYGGKVKPEGMSSTEFTALSRNQPANMSPPKEPTSAAPTPSNDTKFINSQPTVPTTPTEPTQYKLNNTQLARGITIPDADWNMQAEQMKVNPKTGYPMLADGGQIWGGPETDNESTRIHSPIYKGLGGKWDGMPMFADGGGVAPARGHVTKLKKGEGALLYADGDQVSRRPDFRRTEAAKGYSVVLPDSQIGEDNQRVVPMTAKDLETVDMAHLNRRYGYADGDQVNRKGLRGGVKDGVFYGQGGPTQDKVHIRASPGEFIIPADSAQKIGKNKLRAMVAATHKPVHLNSGLRNGFVNAGEVDAWGRPIPPKASDVPLYKQVFDPLWKGAKFLGKSATDLFKSGKKVAGEAVDSMRGPQPRQNLIPQSVFDEAAAVRAGKQAAVADMEAAVQSGTAQRVPQPSPTAVPKYYPSGVSGSYGTGAFPGDQWGPGNMQRPPSGFQPPPIQGAGVGGPPPQLPPGTVSPQPRITNIVPKPPLGPSAYMKASNLASQGWSAIGGLRGLSTGIGYGIEPAIEAGLAYKDINKLPASESDLAVNRGVEAGEKAGLAAGATYLAGKLLRGAPNKIKLPMQALAAWGGASTPEWITHSLGGETPTEEIARRFPSGGVPGKKEMTEAEAEAYKNGILERVQAGQSGALADQASRAGLRAQPSSYLPSSDTDATDLKAPEGGGYASFIDPDTGKPRLISYNDKNPMPKGYGVFDTSTPEVKAADKARRADWTAQSQAIDEKNARAAEFEQRSLRDMVQQNQFNTSNYELREGLRNRDPAAVAAAMNTLGQIKEDRTRQTALDARTKETEAADARAKGQMEATRYAGELGLRGHETDAKAHVQVAEAKAKAEAEQAGLTRQKENRGERISWLEKHSMRPGGTDDKGKPLPDQPDIEFQNDFKNYVVSRATENPKWLRDHNIKNLDEATTTDLEPIMREFKKEEKIRKATPLDKGDQALRGMLQGATMSDLNVSDFYSSRGEDTDNAIGWTQGLRKLDPLFTTPAQKKVITLQYPDRVKHKVIFNDILQDNDPELAQRIIGHVRRAQGAKAAKELEDMYLQRYPKQ